MRLIRGLSATVLTILLVIGSVSVAVGQQKATSNAAPNVAVGPQYDTTHVYVTPADFDHFVASVLTTFGGTTTKQVVANVTPTPSSTLSQLILTPVGSISVFGYKTPVPYLFGVERTGYLVSDIDVAVRAARATGADVLVTPFDDPIGKDAIIQWPGGVNTQLYWHTTAPSYKPLETIPENRVYVSSDRADSFIHSFLSFSQGEIVSDESQAPGIEIGRPRDTYRRVRISSNFGRLAVLVTDGQLPYPYGREITGYEVTNLADTLAKAKGAGATILVAPYQADQRQASFVQFPGGYIAEIHSVDKK
jgi:predicted enzyme related to lactoylglutathione lyase